VYYLNSAARLALIAKPSSTLLLMCITSGFTLLDTGGVLCPGLPCRLNTNFPLQNFLTAELGNSTFSLLLSVKVNERVSDSTPSARIGGDRNRFTVRALVTLFERE